MCPLYLTVSLPDFHSPSLSSLLLHRTHNFGPGYNLYHIKIEFHAVELNAQKAAMGTRSYPVGKEATFDADVWPRGAKPGWGEHITPREYIHGKVKHALLNIGEGVISQGIRQLVEAWGQAPPEPLI